MEKSNNVIYQLSGAELEEVVKNAVKSAFAEMKDIVSAENTDRLLTRDETAKTLGTTTVSLWRWAKQGILVPIKMGSKSCYKWSDVREFMERGC